MDSHRCADRHGFTSRDGIVDDCDTYAPFISHADCRPNPGSLCRVQ